MPLVDLTPENRVEDKYAYPKLSLDKGDRARILVLEKPTMNFIHTLRAPRVESGRLVLDQDSKPVMDFIGRPICVGDFETLMAKGADPDNCPVCKEAKASDKVEGAQRRYAMNVIKYALKPGGFEVSKPLNVEVVVWAFTARIFNILVTAATDWAESGGLKQHDLGLGPCEVKQFQKFDINVLAKAEWLQSDATKKLVSEVYKSSKIDDLEFIIGRNSGIDFLTEDLNKVLHANRLAYGGGLDATPAEVDTALNTDDLFGSDGIEGVAAEPEAKEEKKEAVEDFDDLLSGI